MLDRPCPDCGAAAPRSLGALPDVAFFAGRALAQPLPGGELLHCARCDLRWRHPHLGTEAYARLYDNSEVGAWSTGPLRKDQRLVQQALAGLQPGARVLDFGCYSGGFLAALPAGVQRFGVEVNAAAAAQARQHGNADVRADLSHFDAALRFDAIVLMDVIEHVPSPRALLATLLARLAPQGRLVVTTGDGANWLWRSVGARWWYCHYPEHIAFVSRRWLAFHAAGLGLRVLQAQTFNYLDQPRHGALKRAKVWLRHALQPARAAARHAAQVASSGRDDGVPGIGLSRDHLLLVASPLPANPTKAPP